MMRYVRRTRTCGQAGQASWLIRGCGDGWANDCTQPSSCHGLFQQRHQNRFVDLGIGSNLGVSHVFARSFQQAVWIVQ
ncbi:hypothetical protein Poly51_32640 [Rubripirellula tenax]|uniref:Uncharacterized protein n=1 Tax=Rubripirellula tenax TaxID=2528015 RepID=A0A5C6F0H7_9BACT|nr:hypothetical protein Poly51_32640 [Rubripirellula tenax]